MGEKTADDVARELLFPTAGDQEAHAVSVQELLVRNESLRTNDELIAEQLRSDPAFRAEWERTALGRSVALELVRYRAEHDLSQHELAERLGLTPLEVEDMESGDINPTRDTVERITSRLGIGFPLGGPSS
jgi:ribosome-binding protein aMBF1 (putative translation factor)